MFLSSIEKIAPVWQNKSEVVSVSIDVLQEFNKTACPCGKEHRFSSRVVVEAGAIGRLPAILEEFGVRRVFVLSDRNTEAAAGRAVKDTLTAAGVTVSGYVFDEDAPEPDESHVGLAVMHADHAAQAVIGVGSGVINDISKILAATAGKPYIIVGTAPSMDGYASATSSMTVQGLKISLPSKCADVIIGDLDVLCQAPLKMMASGLGDMLAKYVSIAEWRIAALVTGEYYCEKVAHLVRTALARCVDNADGLLRRDPVAVAAVFEGLVIGGVAMTYAGLSRPASGVEHYLSHIWDMRGAALGTPVELHGVQCALGTLLAARLYERLTAMTPDRDKALAYAAAFDFAAWSDTLRQFLGKGAESMIALEEKEQKYDLEKHRARLAVIEENWQTIRQILQEELPPAAQLESLLVKLGLPTTMEQMGLDSALLPLTFRASKDIRDKYVLSRLCWDLGVLDEITEG